MKRVFAILTAMVMLLALAGCSAKEAMTAEEFTQYAEAHDFSVMDFLPSSGMEGELDAYLVASNGNYDLEFLACATEDEARQGYANICASLEEGVVVTTLSVSTTGTNSESRYFNSDGVFYMAFRVENTVLCTKAHVDYRSEILEHVEAMGYK